MNLIKNKIYVTNLKDSLFADMINVKKIENQSIKYQQTQRHGKKKNLQPQLHCSPSKL